MKIKVLEKTEGCFPQQFKIGDWIDLATATDINLRAPQANKMHIRSKGKNQSQELRTRDVDFDYQLIPLGVAMELPAGCEAHLLPRSSTFQRYGIICANSLGMIENCYKGDDDEWKFPAVATRTVTIPKGKRIAQFRITLSQKATIWQKIKWLFTSPKIEFVKVDSLGNKNRKGIGEGTGE